VRIVVWCRLGLGAAIAYAGCSFFFVGLGTCHGRYLEYVLSGVGKLELLELAV
jgi:hypothetical protein